MSDEVLTVKKDRVLAAADQCADVKRAMQTLFPEAFATATPPQKGAWQ